MDNAIKVLKSKRVPVLEIGTEEYERSVGTPNLLFRFSRPDCVVQPETIAHVQTIIKHAKTSNLQITIKCAGHSYAGHSTAVRGISLDLRRMKNVSLDIRSGIVTIDAGCQWGNVYKTLINGRHNGYIINGGRCPFVGVSGFILGGGLGPFTRSFGMGSDTLKEAKIVTADGKLVTVKDSDDPTSDEGRLFWALRGAGGGNFGVLVQMKLKVQQLQNKDGVVVAGRYNWYPKSGISEDVLATMNDFYTTDWSNQMTIDSTWLCDLRQSTGDGVRFTIYYDGDQDDFNEEINKYIKDPDLAKQLKRRSLREKSTRFLHETLVLQWSEESKRSFPDNRTYSIYSSFVFDNDRNRVQKVTAIIQKEMEVFRSLFLGERVEFLVTWIHSGGKATQPSPSKSAFFWRKAVYHTYVTLEWEDKWMERDMRGFLGELKKKLRPFSLDSVAAFINFPDGVLGKSAHEQAYFGGNREELRDIKEIWDRDNFFKWDQGVQLPGDASDNNQSDDVETPNEEDQTDKIAGEQWEYFKTKDFMADLKDLADIGF